ncbi:unnamed protein product [Cylindrotheca closterium]|uniref:Uncharacterized protein n=1 Tax=Cylindrotheca closterium TaxID=2856 RepID=A0AAD2PXT9_9STRA|nr:unnamed protein product [Cylindrotheca closterium]
MGTLYGTIHDIIDEKLKQIPEGAIQAVTRLHQCDVFYKEAIAAAMNANNDTDQVADGSTRCSGYDEDRDSSAKKRRIHSLQNLALDGCERQTAEKAHLLPHSSRCASYYGELLEALVGVELKGDAKTRKRKLQILIHGVLDKETSKRKAKTGIKHCKMNMIRVLGQSVMDKNPNRVLFLPIMTLEDVLNFNDQTSFSVAILCATPSVYQAMLWLNEYELVTKTEMKLALKTLESFTLAVAKHRKNLQNNGQDDFNSLETIGTEKTYLDEARENIKNSMVQVATLKTKYEGTNEEDTFPKVMKIELSNQQPKGKVVATTCDPWLLCLKSAVMYSSFLGKKLLPGCRDHDSETTSDWSGFQDCWYIPPVPEEVEAVATDCGDDSDLSSIGSAMGKQEK